MLIKMEGKHKLWIDQEIMAAFTALTIRPTLP